MGWVVIIGLFCVPFLPALGLTMGFLDKNPRLGAVWGALIGVGITFCFLAFASAKGWLSDNPGGCGSDGCLVASVRGFFLEVIGISFLIWLLGVSVGAAIHFGLAARRRRRSVSACASRDLRSFSRGSHASS
ncbi:MAG TPA: hypothetical protein VGH79_06200 [Gaiellaceae bacterium]